MWQYLLVGGTVLVFGVSVWYYRIKYRKIDPATVEKFIDL